VAKHTQNLIVSLQQEISLIKKRAAERTLEFFVLRKKLQAATSKLSTAILPRRKVTKGCQVEEHLSSARTPACPTADTEAQTEIQNNTAQIDCAGIQTHHTLETMEAGDHHHQSYIDGLRLELETQHANQLEAVEHRARKQVLDLQAETINMLAATKKECEDRISTLYATTKEYEDRINDLIKLNEVLVMRCKAQQAELVALK
jgi:hypothetical protein